MAEKKSNEKKLPCDRQNQEQAIRDLLSNVAGTRVKALEEMIEDIFEAVDETPNVVIEGTVIEKLEIITDQLYNEHLAFAQGKQQYQAIASKHLKRLPAEYDVQDRVNGDAETLADFIDDMCGKGRSSNRGREEIENIRKSYNKLKEDENAQTFRKGRRDHHSDSAPRQPGGNPNGLALL